MVKLHVKWGKESYELESPESNSFDDLQAQLFSLTLVPPARQKVMKAGRMLKDSGAVAALKDGDKLVLMGTADPPPKEPEKKIVFLEDMSDAQKIGVVKDLLSAGLHNLGNTCYMASTLQCMRAVPELKQALINKAQAAPSGPHDPQAAVVRQLGNLYRDMDRTTQAVTPMMFTTVFRSTFPQFAETSPEGHWMQQDAEEALIQLMNCMANVLKTQGITGQANAENNTIDEYFGGKLETTTKLKGFDESSAASSAAAPPKVEVESYRRLRCFIDIETNFLFQGIKAGLREELELRGQLYERTSTLLTLPRYLIVQMMRFGWRNDTKKKSKILRKVDFPMRFDIMEFTHPTLKHQLASARNLIKAEQDAKLGLTPLNKKLKTEAGQTPGSAAATSSTAAAAASSDDKGAAAMDVDSGASPAASSSSSLTLTTPTSGFYELFAVVTHKGRTSDSGHYVSWCKQSRPASSEAAAASSSSSSGVSSGGDWLKFDDDVVTRVKEEDVKMLHGGGDRDMAYLLFYARVDDTVKWQGQSIPEPSNAPAPTFDNAKKAEAAKTDAAAASSK